MMSFHWSNTATLKLPFGMLVMVKLPSPSHLANAMSSSSGIPTET